MFGAGKHGVNTSAFFSSGTYLIEPSIRATTDTIPELTSKASLAIGTNCSALAGVSSKASMMIFSILSSFWSDAM